MDLYDAARTLVSIMHEKRGKLHSEDMVKNVFLLYLERMLEQLSGALKLIHEEDLAPSCTLARSALECRVDLANLAQNPKYVLLLRAMLLEQQSAVFHFRTEPLYSQLVAEMGQAQVTKMGKARKASFREGMRQASEHFPMVRNQARNLSLFSRFRLAGMEEVYHTSYSILSMQAHNSLGAVLLDEGMRMYSPAMEAAQEDVERAMVLHFIIEMLVATHVDLDAMFGHDDAFTRAFIQTLTKGRRGSRRAGAAT